MYTIIKIISKRTVHGSAGVVAVRVVWAVSALKVLDRAEDTCAGTYGQSVSARDYLRVTGSAMNHGGNRYALQPRV